MHKIENEFLLVAAREYGGELTSIYDKKSNTERLWQAEPEIWGWHAPVLFPVVGRCLNDVITIDGVQYPMDKHGFARKANFKLLELGDSKMVFSLSDNAATIKSFPFRFEFLIAYRLKGNALIVSYEVRNRDSMEILFCIGGHPAFATNLMPGEQYEDYYLEFEVNETARRHHIDGDGFFDGRKSPVFNGNNTINLHPALFNDDALIFKDLKSRKVSLKSKKHPLYLTTDYTGFNYFGVWAKPNAPYVCLEPWLGCADTAGKNLDFKQKEGVITVPKQEEFSVSYTITVG